MSARLHSGHALTSWGRSGCGCRRSVPGSVRSLGGTSCEVWRKKPLLVPVRLSPWAQACFASRRLVLCADPSPVPQLLAMNEVEEARSAFLRSSLSQEENAPTAEDFLKKPTHLVHEEQTSKMEDLEVFTEEMLGIERRGAEAEVAEEALMAPQNGEEEDQQAVADVPGQGQEEQKDLQLEGEQK
eukprot:gnl/TRDRNA2_/TRDRNA2_136939_c1_seq2.p3 gnl/TRDRNA2_/TRDRNA2_136939_c1~~gnl/TRDRNA2_/TRDRNA2_136939_c1_seq2.p3  ORF type:complete len:185 (-),score=49.55 gnl/TRDRNA2_/TRDRNA2_136939_c1_seq2:57-611(-)